MTTTKQESQIPRSMLDKFHSDDWGANKLKEISVFKLFTHEELKELWERGEVRTLKSSTHAVIEGEPSRGVYIILHGSVSVHKNDTITGTMHRIAFLDEGTTFGELSLFDHSPRSATVVAETFCYLFALDAEEFELYLEEKGDNAKMRFYKSCAFDLSERFRAINSDYITSQQLLWKYALRRTDEQNSEIKKVANDR